MIELIIIIIYMECYTIIVMSKQWCYTIKSLQSCVYIMKYHTNIINKLMICSSNFCYQLSGVNYQQTLHYYSVQVGV